MIGVLGLQGDFEAHGKKLEEAGGDAQIVKKPERLDFLDGLIIPGGESTTLINGIDMQARMREMRENMIKTLPPEQRALAEDMLGSEGQVGERARF